MTGHTDRSHRVVDLGVGASDSHAPTRDAAAHAGPATEEIWRALRRSTFAVISHVTPAGAPRSSGVLCQCVGRRMYVATAPDSWKVRHLAADPRVAVVVPVRRGGPLSLVFPIPPATINFHGTSRLLRVDSDDLRGVMKDLERLLPVERRSQSVIIEISPAGEFLTYGIGVPLLKMRSPEVSRGRARVD